MTPRKIDAKFEQAIGFTEYKTVLIGHVEVNGLGNFELALDNTGMA